MPLPTSSWLAGRPAANRWRRSRFRSCELAAARVAWRRAMLAAEGGVVCAVLLLLSGPLLDWRRLLRTIGGHLALTVAILGVLLAARGVAWWAVRLAGLDSPALAAPDEAGWWWVALASPLDFVLTIAGAAAVVALAASSFEQWRRGPAAPRARRARRRPGGNGRFRGGAAGGGCGGRRTARRLPGPPARQPRGDAVRHRPVFAAPMGAVPARGRGGDRHPARRAVRPRRPALPHGHLAVGGGGHAPVDPRVDSGPLGGAGPGGDRRRHAGLGASAAAPRGAGGGGRDCGGVAAAALPRGARACVAGGAPGGLLRRPRRRPRWCSIRRSSMPRAAPGGSWSRRATRRR